MRKIRFTISVLLILLVTAGILANISCKEPTPTPYPHNRPEYSLSIQFPTAEVSKEDNFNIVTAKRGSDVSLPVTIYSMATEEIDVRIVLVDGMNIPGYITFPSKPDFITFTSQQEYVPILPQKSVEITVNFKVAASATPGSYMIYIGGDQKDLPENGSNMAQNFYLKIIDS